MDNYFNSDIEDEEDNRVRIIESSSDDEDTLQPQIDSTSKTVSNDILSSKLKQTIGSIVNEDPRGRAGSDFSQNTA